MDYSSLRAERRGEVDWIFLNRPAQANALDLAFWDELPRLLETLDRDPAVRVVVIAGEGKHFCAGADLSLLENLHRLGREQRCAAEARDALRRELLRLQDSLSAIERLRVPVIAAVHGGCIGAGVDLIAACDLRYAAADARFSIKEIDYGIVADVGTLQRLRHVIGLPMLTELTLTARTFDAAEALQLGLVGASYADRDHLYAEVQALAQQIAAKPPLTVRGVKHHLLYSRDHSVADALQHVATWNASALLSDDGAAALERARSQRRR